MGYQELLIVLVIVLVLFGGAKLPQLMRGVGQGIREFKEGVNEGKQSETPSEDKPASLKD